MKNPPEKPGRFNSPGADGLPQDPSGLEEHFRGQLKRALGLALAERDYAQAYRGSEEVLKSGQRQLLPGIAELLGPGADFQILEFGLSDYAPIFRAAPPMLCCLSPACFRLFWLIPPGVALRDSLYSPVACPCKLSGTLNAMAEDGPPWSPESATVFGGWVTLSCPFTPP